MEFYDVLKKRRSIRLYKDTPVPDEALERILEAVQNAPTACNRQPFKFFIVKDPVRREKLASVYKEDWLKTAPVIVAAASDVNKAWRRREGDSIADADTAIAMEHFVLAAAEENLGTCWICAFERAKANAALDLPEGSWNVFALTPLGYAAAGPVPFVRKEIGEIAEIL
ncbi:MAG: nitroreductase family protein [Lentisphaeria bacterium]|nr:nitroreductase family protein [Lentisphaeria bacterium]